MYLPLWEGFAQKTRHDLDSGLQVAHDQDLDEDLDDDLQIVDEDPDEDLQYHRSESRSWSGSTIINTVDLDL